MKHTPTKDRGRKGIRRLLAGMLAFALAVPTAQAARNWTGNTSSDFSNSNNWGGNNSGRRYFKKGNLTGNKKDFIYLSKDVTETSNTGLCFYDVPDRGYWRFQGQGQYTFDNSGSTSNYDQDLICIGYDGYSSSARFYAITLKTRHLTIGGDTTNGGANILKKDMTGHLVLDDQNNDANGYLGPVNITTTKSCDFYKGDLYATNANITCQGNMTLYNFTAQKTGGDWTVTGDLKIGNGGKTATLTQKNGDFTVNSNKWTRFESGSTCTLNLDGGTFKTKLISNEGATSASIVFNGGTLQANGYDERGLVRHSSINVTVKEGGATVNTGGFTPILNAPFNKANGVAGDLTVTGGGSATFSAMGDLAGAFSVGEDTALHYFDQDASVANYTIAALSLAPGATLALNADATGCDTFSAGATNITATAAKPATIELVLSGDVPEGTSYTLFDTADGRELRVVPQKDGTAVPCRVEVVGGRLVATVFPAMAGEDYTWNSTGTYWGDAGAWNDGSNAAVTWIDRMGAVFATAGAEAVLAANVEASMVTFNQNATVSGAATLTAPTIGVSAGKEATVSTYTAGPLAKTASGRLTLTRSRAEQTTVARGTLAMAPGATVDPAKLTLGVNASKPVTFDYGGQELSGTWTSYLAGGMDITLTNGTFSTTQDPGWWAAGSGTPICPKTLKIAKDATLTTTDRFTWNACASADDADTTNTVNVAGGKLVSTKNQTDWIMQNSRKGALVFNVTDGGTLEFAGEVYALTCRDTSTADDTPALFINISDSTFRITNNKSLRFGSDAIGSDGNGNREPLNVTGVFAATNSTIDVGYGIYVGNNTNGLNLATGSYVVDFEGCVITAKQICVYHDRKQNAVRFNDTRFVVNQAGNYTLETAVAFDTMGEGGTAIKPMTIDAGGLILDTNGKDCQVRADPQGLGALTKVGAGSLKFMRNQTATSPLVVSEGTVAVDAAVTTFNRAISVAEGATLSFAAPLSATTPYATASSFEFASGSTLGLPATAAAGKYKLFTLSSGAFAADAADSITVSGISVPCTVTAEGDTIYLNIAHDYTVVDNGGIASLTVTDDTVLCGAGGVKLSALAFGATSRLTLDPIKTPVYVSAAPTFAEGAKIALAGDYAEMSLGRIVLLTWTGEATLPENLDSLFDASSVAGSVAVTSVTAPNGTSTQLVLTVGDYENNAKEIRILPIGDSITQGVTKDSQGDYPQYRTAIAARLAANGYKPRMLGVWKYARWDAAGILLPEDWIWHCGISGDSIKTSPNTAESQRGGVRDNLHLYLDIAGYTDVITLLIGTNDLGAGNETAEETYKTWTNLVFEIAAQRPDAKIVGATLLDRNGEGTGNHNKVVAFNALLRADYAANNLPANLVLLDLYPEVPLATSGNFFTDKLHMNWKGCAATAEAFAGKIMETLPLATFDGAGDATVTDTPQTALGAAETVPSAYREGLTHVFTLDAANAGNVFYGSAPYTTTNNAVSVNRNVTKVGYYMELVRAGTNRRRYVWVDFDATGRTLEEVDFPWTGNKFQEIVENLHVYSNDIGIKNIAADATGYMGIVEATSANYLVEDAIAGAPADIFGSGDTYGWNDTLTESGAGYGCFQAHRIFSQAAGDEHWYDAQVLFAWNRWGKNSGTDEIGIGDYSCHASGVGNTMDYTFTADKGTDGLPDTVAAGAYQVRHLEIWAAVDMPAETTHGKWIGGAGPNMSNPVNWDDGIVPVAGDDLDFSLVTSATTINGDIGATFGAVTMGTGVITFTGDKMAATNYSDTRKIAVGENATVTVAGDVAINKATGGDGIVSKVDAGGMFVVEGTLSIVGSGAVHPVLNNGAGYIVANAIALNNGGSDDLYSTRDKTSQKWVVGPGGITGTGGIWCLSNKDNDSWMQPISNDFTIAVWTVVRSAIDHFELNTTGFADGLPHTITLDAGFSDDGGPLYVAGTGKVVVNHVTKSYGGKNPFSGAVAVQDSATLQVNSGKKLTSGNITLSGTSTLAAMGGADLGAGIVTNGAGCTLAFPDSATAGVAFTGTTDVQAGAKLSFHGLSGGVTPFTTGRLNVRSGDKVKVSLSAGGVAPVAGTYTLISVTGQTLEAAHASRLELDDPALDASLCTFAIENGEGTGVIKVTIEEPAQTWPEGWSVQTAPSQAFADAYADWSAVPGNDPTLPNAEEAFLLGQNVADYVALEATAIVRNANNTVTIDTTLDLTQVRGRLYVAWAATPDAAAADWTKLSVLPDTGDVSQVSGIDAAASARFFKVGVDYQVGGDDPVVE